MRYLLKYLRAYISHYPLCQFNQIKRYKSYEFFISIITSAIFFYIIVMNFIIALFFIKVNNDYLFIIIYQFIKKNFFILGKEI